LIASALPIALFWNVVRVVATVVGSFAFGAELVVGPLHEAAGLGTFTLGCVTLLAVDAGLRRWLRLWAQEPTIDSGDGPDHRKRA
jgi:exosortase/archaeosortase family protein